MADQRNALHAYLTPESHEAWHEFCAEHGVSVSGMLEAYGQRLQELATGDGTADELDDLVRSARKIDAQRRRRRRD